MRFSSLNLRAFLLSAAALPAVVLLCSCSKQAPGAAAVGTPAPGIPAAPAYPGMEADLANTVKTEPNFYHFKTAADLETDTKGLVWEDGSDLPEYSDPKARKGGTLNLWVPDFPGTLRPVGPDSNASFRQFLLDYITLSFVKMYPDAPGKIQPEIATSWAIDRANKTVYFKLDPNAKWSDGAPFTTDDVVFSWYFYRSPYLQDPWISDYFHNNFTGITIYDKYTFSASVPDIRPDIVLRIGDQNAAMPPMPRHFFKDFGPDWVGTYNWRPMPTTGAYMLKEEDIKRTSSVTLTRIKGWWAENRRFARNRFNPDRIRLNVIHDPDKAVESFLHGDIDLYLLRTHDWYGKVKDDSDSVTSGFTVKTTFYNQVPPPNFGLWLNVITPGLDNLDVRLGIAYATNMDLVCKQYFRGNATIQKTFSDGYGWDPNPALHPRPFDPAKAREYFTKAGFTQQGPDGILANAQGRRLSYTVTTIYRQYQDVLVILKQEALKAGLEFNIEVLDHTTGFQKEQDKKHEITLTAFNRQVDMYPRYRENFASYNAYDKAFLADGTTPNPDRKVKVSTNNLNEIADPVLDQLDEQYEKTATMDEVKVLSAKLEQRVYDDAIWVNGWKQPYFQVGYRPWIKWPADFNPMQAVDFLEFWVMWIDQDEQKADLAKHANGENLPKQILIYDKYK
jgi:microcin C transport system substrate-binding protein